jgi:hypothetical protein
MTRGTCTACGENVAVHRDGLPVAHGPRDERCQGTVPQSAWDASAGRPRGWKTAEERVFNGALVANIVARNHSNVSLWGDRTAMWAEQHTAATH